MKKFIKNKCAIINKIILLNSVVWFLLMMLFLPVLMQLYSFRWMDVDYSHAYLVLPISLWLIWQKRVDIKKIVRPNSKIGEIWLVVLLISLVLFVFAGYREYLFLNSILFIPILFSLISYLYGCSVAVLLKFAIFYLLLLVPPPLGILDSLTIPMRYGVSIVTHYLMDIFHYPIIRNGLLLYVGKYEIYMGSPCSGFRSLISMLAVCLVYAHLNKGKRLKKLLLVLSVIPLALIGNLLRVLGTCLSAYHLGGNFAHLFHDCSGYIIFGLLILSLMKVNNLLEKMKFSSLQYFGSYGLFRSYFV